MDRVTERIIFSKFFGIQRGVNNIKNSVKDGVMDIYTEFGGGKVI